MTDYSADRWEIPVVIGILAIVAVLLIVHICYQPSPRKAMAAMGAQAAVAFFLQIIVPFLIVVLLIFYHECKHH